MKASTALLLLSALAGSPRAQGADAFPVRHVGPGPLHKVVLRDEGPEVLASLRALEAVVREVDYGAFRLLVLDSLPLGGREGLIAAGLEVRDEWNRVAFDGIVFDGTRPAETLGALDTELTLDAESHDAGLYVVQFDGPALDAEVARLDELVFFRQYVPMHAYVVAATPERVPALLALRERPAFQYVGVYQPAFRLTRALRLASQQLPGPLLDVTVQVVDGDDVRAALGSVRALAIVDRGLRRVGPYLNLQLEIDPVVLPALAAHPRVFAIEPRGFPTTRDEVQGQISAGNVSGGLPTGPGYLAWLAAHGFDSSQFGSFSINVVDDATSLTGHPDLPAGRVDFQLNPSNQTGSQDGHGFLNAHIIAGFNDGTGSAVEDAGGYNYGLGIAPWAHVGSTAIFGPSGTNPSSYESSAYASGSRISSNSWSFIDGAQNPIPDYDSNSQQYDLLTRDVQSGTAGNQEYLILFAAGNDGPGANTISTPSTAKNILTVGASENVRTTGTDGCGVSNAGADNGDDIISFTSRGPVNGAGGDGRWKPEISAQGTHVQAGVPQSNYTGAGVCNQYWPLGQTLYGWSSGTSHSTPGVAGGAALVRQWFLNDGQSAPSPALTKAVLVATTEYLTGVNAGDTLPSNTQGMGRMQLERPFGATERMLVDQTQVLGSTGASHVVAGAVADPGEPFRVTLVWTDAPGATTGAPWVNDLDLTVDVGGTLYRGNVFSGGVSTSGGTADSRNNTESVFLPAGTSGAFTVTVSAATIAGDGVPGNGDSTDQDFGLFVWNGTPDGTFAQFTGTPTSGLTPLSVDFTDLSLGNVTSWAWDFGDTGTSSAQNPTHLYTQSGTYTVTLTVDGPDGPDTEVKVDYITASDPPPPGLSDASFESQSAGAAPTTPWTVPFGTGHLVSPSGVTSDNGMPTDGSQWCELAGDSTNNATPPSNPGGAGNPPVGGAGIAQGFTYPAGQSELEFDAAFLRNESANSTYNDWMSVDITDGTSTHNVYYADTFTATTGTSTKYGYAMTPLQTVVVDLLALFPAATPSTQFTLTALVGNGTDNVQPSKGYVDHFRFVGDPIPAAEFSGSPTSGIAPLSVAFNDLSTASPTSWSWDFGDGATSSSTSPAHVYSLPGSYTVALTATNAAGSDVETKLDYVTASFPAATGTLYGTGTSGSGGVPVMEAFREPPTGSPLFVRASGAGAGVPVFLAYSTSSQTPALDLSNGFLLNVGLPIALIVPRTTDAGGEVVHMLNLGPAVTGLSIHCQAITADGAGGDTFASSQGVRVDVP